MSQTIKLSREKIESMPLNRLGEHSHRRLLANSTHLRVIVETLTQDDLASRFYQQPYDTFVFLLTGQLYILGPNHESTLKVNQGLWLKADDIYKFVLIAAKTHFVLITIQTQTDSIQDFEAYLTTVSTGSAQSTISASGSCRWVLSQHPGARIELEQLPGYYAEHFHYHRHCEQFILALSDSLELNVGTDYRLCPKDEGYLFPIKQRHSIINTAKTKAFFLSVYLPRDKHDRVLVLRKSKSHRS